MNAIAWRLPFLANAAFSGACGLALAVFGPRVSDAVLATSGSAAGMIFRALGVSLVLIAAFLCSLALSRRPNLRAASAIAFSDAAWVALSLVWIVVARGSLTPLGVDLVGIVAAIIAVFAAGELAAIRVAKGRLGSKALPAE